MTRTLLSAVKSDNVVLAKTILHNRLYGNIDLQDARQDGTALFWACTNGLSEIVFLLLFHHNANLEASTAWCATPLHAAADNNRLDIARLLISYGANVNKKTIYGDTPCHLAAYRGHVKMVQMLVELGDVDLNLTNSKNRTSLDEAILASHSHVTNYICHVMSEKYSIPIQLSDRLMTEMSLDFTEEDSSSSLDLNETDSLHSSTEMLSCGSLCESEEDKSKDETELFKMASKKASSSSSSSYTSEEGKSIDHSFSLSSSSLYSTSFPKQNNLSDFDHSSKVSSVTHSCNSSNILDNNIFLNDLSTISPTSDSISNMNFMNIFAIQC